MSISPLPGGRRQASFSLAVRTRALSAAVVAAVLTGCVAEMPSPPGNDRFLVEPVRLTHQVTFAGDGTRLDSAEAHLLAAFLDEADPDHEADIYLDAQGQGKDGRVDAVAAALDVLGRESQGAGADYGSEHGVTVTLVQDVFLPESCLNGDRWPDPRLPPASCTQALTLVRMVEDKNDLLRGRKLGPALSETAANAAAEHLGRDRPAPAEELPAAVQPVTPQQIPPSPLTREASY